jgi:hypothetical protein
MLAALITWWTVRGELLMVPVAAVVVVLACTLWGWKILRSGKVFFATYPHGARRFDERCSAGKIPSLFAAPTLAATGVASVQSGAALRRYIGGVWQKLSCLRRDRERA